MAHFSHNASPLKVSHFVAVSVSDVVEATRAFSDVCLLVLPQAESLHDCSRPFADTNAFIRAATENLQTNAVLAILGDIGDLIESLAAKGDTFRYQHWIAIKRLNPITNNHFSLPHHHIGLLILTNYKNSLRHTKTRIQYSYCPACDKTSKDYGGKKHTYHEYGTLLSDVWRDIEMRCYDTTQIVARLADLFGLDPYAELRVIDLTHAALGPRQVVESPHYQPSDTKVNVLDSKLVLGDCLDTLETLPSSSVDFAFTDPPYNLRKAYAGYSDDLAVLDYFKWCDAWITQIARLLKPGRTFALLNLPLWAVRHFMFLCTRLQFQNWVVWDALSYPVRLIMPAHYTILCFSKGAPRPLPGLIGQSGDTKVDGQPRAFDALNPMAEGFCLRSTCLDSRRALKLNDRALLTDLWWDIHRLKHNTRRVDHPTQLPPHLLYRLISLFTSPGETVLDCFNGAGTTTLAAHQLGRKYYGIEKSQSYHELAVRRHNELQNGIDPFRKANRELTAKNSPVPRLTKQKYIVPKKALQLEVKRIAHQLSRLPTREDVIQYGKYPIELYDRYFVSWGEVCAAARTTGMTEIRAPQTVAHSEETKQLDLGLPSRR